MPQITPIKKGFNDPNLIYYDIETNTDENGKMIFRLGCFTLEGFSFVCYDADTFTDKLIEVSEKRRFNYYIAHNANFDFSLLNHDFFNSFELRTFSTHPFIIHYLHEDLHKHNTNIIFIDSMSFFKNSLDEMGKIFGNEKITVDILRNKFDSEITEYCKQDTIIVKDMMEFIKDQCIKYDIEFPITFAQMSYTIYRRHFLSLKIGTPDNQNIMMLERQSYFGGRVEGFNFNKFDAKTYDINSLYPYVMRNNYFPIKLVGYFNNENCYSNQESVMAFLADKLESNELVIARVLVTIPECYIGPIPLRYNNKIVFPTGTFETTLCTPELQLIKDYILEVRELTHYAREKIFSNYIDTFYEERKKYHKPHPNNLFYKLLMNSLYGKFGQRRYEFTRFEDFDEILKFGATDLDNGNDDLIKIHFFNYKAYRKDIFYDNPHSFVAIASFVTSYARRVLYENMINNFDKVLYCDTDSMIVNTDPEHIKIGEELGQWKLEKEYTNFQVLGNKHYKADNELKVKGVPKDAEMLSDYDFKFEKITKMKESIVRYKDPTPRVILVTKHYNDEYDKRQVLKDKTTIPLKVLESQEVQVSLT